MRSLQFMLLAFVGIISSDIHKPSLPTRKVRALCTVNDERQTARPFDFRAER